MLAFAEVAFGEAKGYTIIEQENTIYVTGHGNRQDCTSNTESELRGKQNGAHLPDMLKEYLGSDGKTLFYLTNLFADVRISEGGCFNEKTLELFQQITNLLTFAKVS